MRRAATVVGGLRVSTSALILQVVASVQTHHWPGSDQRSVDRWESEADELRSLLADLGLFPQVRAERARDDEAAEKALRRIISTPRRDRRRRRPRSPRSRRL